MHGERVGRVHEPAGDRVRAGDTVAEPHAHAGVGRPGDLHRVLEGAAAGFHLAGAPREAVLTQYLVNPALSKISGTLAAQDAFHRAVYGQVVLRPLTVSVTAAQAEVRDCQDTSDSGVVDLKTGNKVTVGIPRALVITTLVYAGDAWRIATIDYQGPKC